MMKSYSQYKQDLIVSYLLNNQKKGFFLDIGAHDGISLSNTYALENEQQWNGILIEPNPVVFDDLNKNRTSISVNAAIAENNGKMIFRLISGYAEMLSGLLCFFSSEHIKRIDDEIKKYGGSFSDIEIDCLNINDLLQKYQVEKIDYLSIDVEGAEEKILRSIDLNHIYINVITAENADNDKSLRLYMKERGYTIVNLGTDDLFILNPSEWRLLFVRLYAAFYRFKIKYVKLFFYLKNKMRNILYKCIVDKYKKYRDKDKITQKDIFNYVSDIENPIILEAGAADGSDTLRFSKQFPLGYIYAFEPVSLNYNACEKKLKECSNVSLFKLALGDFVGKTFINVSTNKSQYDGIASSSSLLTPKKHIELHPEIVFEEKEEVEVTTIDEFAKQQKLSRIDIMWLDLQGLEYKVLKASPNILKTVRVIYTEVSLLEMYEDTVLYGEYKDWLLSQGFKVVKEELKWKDMGNVLFVREKC